MSSKSRHTQQLKKKKCAKKEKKKKVCKHCLLRAFLLLLLFFQTGESTHFFSDRGEYTHRFNMWESLFGIEVLFRYSQKFCSDGALTFFIRIVSHENEHHATLELEWAEQQPAPEDTDVRAGPELVSVQFVWTERMLKSCQCHALNVFFVVVLLFGLIGFCVCVCVF